MYYDGDHDEVLISQFGKRTKPGDFSWNPFPAPSSITRFSGDDIAQQMKENNFVGNYDDSIWVPESNGLKWPNQMSKVPSEFGDYVVIPDGFLPPTKEDGNIFLGDRDGNTYRITPKTKGAFYHLAEWFDFDGDGVKDMLTVRAIKSGLFTIKFEGQLVWYRNPGTNNMLTQEWEEHIITTGPDVYFKTKMYNGMIAVFATEFFRDDPMLSIHFLTMSGEHVSKRIIDANMGNPFGVEFVDLDGDGREELMATNHQDETDTVKMAIFAYEVPDDLINGEFKRHTLTYNPSSIKVNTTGVGAPGFAHGFYPKVGMSGKKHVICAGDGSFDVWYLTPGAGRFEYNTQIIDINGTTGELLVRDFDGDGVMDALIPDNDYWKVCAMTFEQR